MHRRAAFGFAGGQYLLVHAHAGNLGSSEGWMLRMRPSHAFANHSLWMRMKPASQTSSTRASRSARSISASKASRLENGLCGMTLVGMFAACAI